MTNEEKEARYLITILEGKKFTAQGEALRTYIEELNKNINKLQKENEELKELVGVTTIRIKPEDITMVADKFVSKDKIRTKIKELEELFDKNEKEITIQYQNQFIVDVVEVLEELLGDDEQ